MKQCQTCKSFDNLASVCPKCKQTLKADCTVLQCPSCHKFFADGTVNCPACLQGLDYLAAKYCRKCRAYCDASKASCATCKGKLADITASKCRKCGRLASQSSPGCDCAPIALVAVAAKRCPKCARKGVTTLTNCPVCGAMDDVLGKVCKRCGKMFPPTATRCDGCEQTLPFGFDKGCELCNTLSADPLKETQCGDCHSVLSPAKVCSKCKAFTFDTTATHCAECGKLAPEQKGLVRTRSALKRGRTNTTIEQTARESDPHDVKGTKRGNPAKFCVRIWTETIRWDLDDRNPREIEFKRPFYFEARVKCTKVKKPRKQPPVPLSSSKTDEVAKIEDKVDETAAEELAPTEALSEDAKEDGGEMATIDDLKAAEEEASRLGPLQDFDKGHLVALFLGGVDNSWQIVPQVRDVNRGSWLAMESEIFAMAKDTASLAVSAGLMVRGTNTLANRAIDLEVYIHHSDVGGTFDIGDPRIPACFYVRVWLTSGVSDRAAIAHYLLLNRSRNVTPWPGDSEIAAFRYAHKALKLAMPVYAATHPSAKPADYDPWPNDLPDVPNAKDYTSVPYGALQWLHDTDQYVVVSSFAAAAYESSAISLIRKYNLWRNVGFLGSDADAKYSGKEWNKDEKPDPFPVLDESSGQAYPEVDHIVPKKSGGLNSYANARLVSFSLNHIYREKPAPAPNTWSTISGLKDRYSDAALRDSDVRIRNDDDTRFPGMFKARREYLRNIGKRDAICEAQRKRAPEFAKLQSLHRSGVDNFLTNIPAELTAKIAWFGMLIPLTVRGPLAYGLSGLSDKIKGITE